MAAFCVLLYESCDLRLVSSPTSCLALAPLQAAQILAAAGPAFFLIAAEIRALRRGLKRGGGAQQRREHDRDFQMAAAQLKIEFFDFKSARPLRGRELLPEDDELLLLETEHQAKPPAPKKPSWWPLVLSVSIAFVTASQSLWVYQLPDSPFWDVVFQLLALATLAAYPLVLSVTPFWSRPRDVADCLNSPHNLAAFGRWLEEQADPRYLSRYRALLRF